MQDLFTTASTEWARRAHSVLVRPACVHQGKVHNPTLRIEWAEGPHHSSIRFAYVYPTASTAEARRAYAVLVRLACVHHGQIRYQSQLDAV